MIGYQGIVEVSSIYRKAFSEDFHPRMVGLDRLLPKSLFPWAKTFFDKSKAHSRRCQNSPLGLKQLTSLIFHFAKGLLAKNVLMTAQRDFRLGNSLSRINNLYNLRLVRWFFA
jgi:hypothetical protein